MKQTLLSAAVAFAAMFGLAFTTPTVAHAATRDCDTNAIIECGALDAAELKKAYAANESKDLPAVFSHYGITKAMINGDTMKMGSVTKDGKVIVDGKTVATGARSIGRENLAGSSKITINSNTYYQRPTSVSFNADSIPAFVFMDTNGQFKAAVITSCGNPVKATPVKPQPKPAFACTNLSTTGTGTTRRMTATATAKNGATITGYRFDFGDGTTLETDKKTASHTYKEAGDYDANVVVLVDVDGKETEVSGDKCVAGVTISQKAQPPVETCPIKGKESLPKDDEDCVEEAPEETPEVLPETGAVTALSGMVGAGSLAAAGYYYRLSRKDMIAKILGRK